MCNVLQDTSDEMCMNSTQMIRQVERGSGDLNIERLASGWSDGMEFTAVLVLIEWVKTGC